VRRPLIDVHHPLSRREFLRGAAGASIAGAGVVLLGACGSDESKGSPTSTPEAVDPPPETTTIRLTGDEFALYLAEQFLPAEGFTDVQYIDVPPINRGVQELAAGAMDIGLLSPSSAAVAADAGDPLVVLAGLHNSDFELIGNDRVQSLRDLKGTRIWVASRDDPSYFLMAALLAYVGIDIEREVEFVELIVGDGPSFADLIQQFQAGTIDVMSAVRPYSTALRNANIGHVVLDGTVDPPWSQYFGGMVTGNRDFAEKHPAATKRALRAILKAADVCAREPERAARYDVDNGLASYTYDQALDAITGISYAAWREFDPEDTLRFYALRLKEAGIVKSTPAEIIARGTDWRYLEEIKRELAV